MCGWLLLLLFVCLQTFFPCHSNLKKQEYMLNFTSDDLPEEHEAIMLINQTKSIRISLVLNSDCEHGSIDEPGRLKWMIRNGSYLVVLVSVIGEVST